MLLELRPCSETQIAVWTLQYIAHPTSPLEPPLLLVVLNHLYFAHARGFRIEPCLSFRSALAKQVPALIQILFDPAPSRSLGFAGVSSLFLLEELVVLIHQLAYPDKNVLIFHLDPSSCAYLASRLCSPNAVGHDLVRPFFHRTFDPTRPCGRMSMAN
jgi:hypothetical protein